MSGTPETTPCEVFVSCYTVSCVPESLHPLDYDLFSVKVEYAGFDRWAVRWLGRCLSRAGEWNYEPIPSSREDDWLDMHRFSSHMTAIKLATDAARNLTVNGHTVASILEKRS